MIRPVSTAMVLGLILSSAGLASAKEVATRIHIRVIYAVKSDVKSIDPALADIRAELVDLPFGKFRLLDKLECDVPLNSAVELQLPGQRAISVKFLGLDEAGKRDMLALQLSVKPALNMQLRIADGGRTLLVGPSHLEGKLILDLSASLKEKDR